MKPSNLPIDSILPALQRTLSEHPNVILQAPPGAGKTTQVPLALLEAPWLEARRIVMLEPRRLAARAAAARMSQLLNEDVGRCVGYRMRLNSRVSSATRIEVVTEGVLTRRLQSDPALEEVGLVIFDEFHERSLQADLGLALCLDAQAALRPDLRLLIMSATLDGTALAELLGDAPILTSEGQSFPVETYYAKRPPILQIEREIAATILRVLKEEPGDILVFLPGAAEIRRVAGLLEHEALGPRVTIAPLYGDLPFGLQEQAIRPSPKGQRKIVLATSIAETSLTIEGIRGVVDSGLMRVPRFDPQSGMSRLDTVRISRASADQRRGRAGRLAPGVCYRLWTEENHKGLSPHTAPEILQVDLTPLALELACWGIADPGELAWLDPPPAAAFAVARELLAELDGLDARGRITPHGRTLAELGLHPRLGHMVIQGKNLGWGALACELAAILSDRDILKGYSGGMEADLRLRLDILHVDGGQLQPQVIVDRGARERVLKMSDKLQRRLGISPSPYENKQIGLLLALAYPDRIAQRRPGSQARYLLSNGRGAWLGQDQSLAGEEWLVAAELDGQAREARIFLAAPVDRSMLEQHCSPLIHEQESIEWDDREQAVRACRQRRLGALVLEERSLTAPDPKPVIAALLEGIRKMGLGILPWDRDTRNWQARVLFLHRLAREGELPNPWPDVSDAWLESHLEEWLTPWLTGLSRREHLEKLDLRSALHSLLSWEEQRRLDEEAPTRLHVPSGSRISLDYLSGEVPVLAVRLQELFGLSETPRIARGRVAVKLHLLSPAGRPVQVTQDLTSFWHTTYPEVKKDLKGRYPKHHWPDDPFQAEPTHRAKRSFK